MPRPVTGELLVSEIFGPTIQGEGPYAGQPTSFLRLGACNLNCSWCDTKYTWDSGLYDLTRELRPVATNDVAQLVLQIDTPNVVVTGGEPALQADELARLAVRLRAAERSVHLETSGSVALGPLLDQCDFVVASPKLGNSGVKRHARLRWPVLREIAARSRSVFKFVVREPTDLEEVAEIVQRLGVTPDRVWVMPEATTASALLTRMAELAEEVTARKWSLSPRLQVLVWDNERGR